MANEKRLIGADEAIEKINCLCVDGNENWIGTDNQSFVDHADVIDILSDMPTVDAVEVVHAHWDNNGICTLCGYPIPTDSKYDFIDKDDCLFCYHCGAKMDGGNEDGVDD